MDESPGIPDTKRGLYPKYRAIKIAKFTGLNGTVNDTASQIKVAGFPAEEVSEPFFLLKFSDPYARKALMAYAAACVDQYPQLADDIRQKLVDTIDQVEKSVSDHIADIKFEIEEK